MPYFTGTIRNFFNSTNWQPTSETTFLPSTSYLYVTNDVDSVTLFDGTNLARPGFYINQAQTTRITHALDVKVYNNRLLLLRPRLTGGSNSDNQGIFFSARFSPFNFINDVAGNGGALSAATAEILQSAEFLRDELLISFSSSTWDLQRTGIAAVPFNLKKLNDSKATNAPYGAIDYDDRITNVGNTGLIACDGVNVQRYDIPVIDVYETLMDQQYFNQVFAERYDNLSQGWMLFVSSDNLFPLIDGLAPASDKALIYNFLENTWATYSFTVPMTCLGKGVIDRSQTWQNSTFPWADADGAWDSYANQRGAPILLGGTSDSRVLWLDNDDYPRDAMIYDDATSGESFAVTVNGTQWCPFVKDGQKTQFGYIDVYYTVADQTSGDPVLLSLLFNVDQNTSAPVIRPLTLDATSNPAFGWKRIYVNLIGQFIQMEIVPTEDEDSAFSILGFVLWARPAGRMSGP
jgi:hypothetical protein